MEAYYVMTYGAKSGSLPLLPPLFENNEAGGDFLAKEALDAVKDAEQKAMQKAKADLAAAKQSAETAAAAEQRTAQQETAALAEDIRKKAQQNSANVIRAIREAITG